MIGTILIYIAFGTSAISTILYFFSTGKRDFKKIARIFFHLTSVSIIFASAYLLSAIFSHDFSLAYVWEYSNRDLGTPLLLSTFFAGQEGSFLLWALFSVIIGIFLLSYTSKIKYFEAPVMAMFTLIIAFLSLLLILKSPFTLLWDKFSQAKLGSIPEDGRGLNPILQNFWMVIHPPILFIGFASMAAPFAFAVASLINKKFNDWIAFAMPWLLFASGILGLGIILGGYWAYGVLGWGGYWAWDPVENSSLIPWIISVAAIHIMLAQKATGGYKKTNIILNILAFLFVLYSTFLTRSGVLQNASVHSFVEPGAEVYWALVGFILSFLIISVINLVRSWNLLGKEKTGEPVKINSREAWLYIGSLILLASAAIIIAGTSLPLFAKSTVEAGFYNSMNIPLAILILFLAGLAFYLDWRITEGGRLWNKIMIPVILSAISAIILFVFGVKDILYVIFAFAAFFTFFSSIHKLSRQIKKKKVTFGASLSHIGLALFFLGIIGSARYSEEKQVSLELNVPTEEFGYKFTYLGSEQFQDPENKRDEKFHLNVAVEKDNKELILKPVMYASSFMEGNIIKNPDIANFVAKDLYLSPLDIIAPEKYDSKDVHNFMKGEQKDIGDIKIKFVDFDFGKTQMGSKNMMAGNYSINSVFTINKNGKFDTLKLKLNYVNSEPEPEPLISKLDSNLVFYFASMNVKGQGDKDSSSAEIAVVDSKKQSSKKQTETFVATIAIKPYIGVLWFGAFIMVVGFMYSIFRRVKDIKRLKV